MKEDRRKRDIVRSKDWTVVLFVAAMLGFCVAMPFFFGHPAPYLEGLGRYLPLESRYLGPALFALAHLAMIPLFFGKPGKMEGDRQKWEGDL